VAAVGTDPAVADFFRLLAVCHTVQVEVSAHALVTTCTRVCVRAGECCVSHAPERPI
jgi:hypothetical protein